jgi:putative hydrolase of the HAD superfamily
MMALKASERRDLVMLWRELSPHELPLEPPALRPDLAALDAKPLPRAPRAILFDVYGTLLLSAAGGKPALAGKRSDGGEKARTLLEESLAEIGFAGGPSVFAAEVAGRINLKRKKALSRTSFPEVEIDILVARIAKGVRPHAVRRLALLLEASLNPCAVMPGAKSALSRLRAANARLGLVSNAQFYTPLLLEASFGATLGELGFEQSLVAFSYEQGIAKPAKEIFERAARALLSAGIAADEILVIGNSSINDIAPAKELGFMTAFFAGDIRSFRPSEPGTPGATPDSLLTSLDDLESIFPPSARTRTT